MEIKHILIIDDSKAEQIYLSEMLLFEGFVPIVASSADEAQKSLESYRPDLILMDVVMPGKSGFQYTSRQTVCGDYVRVQGITWSSPYKKRISSQKLMRLQALTKPLYVHQRSAPILAVQACRAFAG
jgi:CheY-like chemotaxis protein